MSAQPPTLARLLGTWTLDPVLLVRACCAAAALYVWGMRRAPQTLAGVARGVVPGGLLVLALALLSGIDQYADELLSVHVVEHLLLILVAPLLLLWGAPVRLALSACPAAGRRRDRQRFCAAARCAFLTRPACGFALFTVVVLGTHLTGVYEAALRNQTIHALEHAAYFWSGTAVPAAAARGRPDPAPAWRDRTVLVADGRDGRDVGAGRRVPVR